LFKGGSFLYIIEAEAQAFERGLQPQRKKNCIALLLATTTTSFGAQLEMHR